MCLNGSLFYLENKSYFLDIVHPLGVEKKFQLIGVEVGGCALRRKRVKDQTLEVDRCHL